MKLDFPKDFPAMAKDLVTKLLKKNPKSRLKIPDIKAHPWLGSKEKIFQIIYLNAVTSDTDSNSKGNYISNYRRKK